MEWSDNGNESGNRNVNIWDVNNEYEDSGHGNTWSKNHGNGMKEAVCSCISTFLSSIFITPV